MKKGCEQVVDKGVLCAIKQKDWGEKKGCNVLFDGRGLQRYQCVASACSLGSSSRFTVSSVHKYKKHVVLCTFFIQMYLLYITHM